MQGFQDLSPGKVYSHGPYETSLVHSREEAPATASQDKSEKVQGPAPKPLLIAVPKAAETFPVIMLQHGFCMYTDFYSQLMQHVASHGYIIVAPQMYSIWAQHEAPTEIADMAKVVAWLPAGLARTCSKVSRAQPDLSKLAIAGHSRGGKVAFGLALGIGTKSPLPFSGVAALDPVDGMTSTSQTEPPVLKFSEGSFESLPPALILGTGLGSLQKNRFFPACAPEGVSHAAFFRDCRAPAYHFVAPHFGHMDLLDDKTRGLVGLGTHIVAKNGPSREGLRRLAGGLLVAFFNSVLKRNDGDMSDALQNPLHAPVQVQQARK